MVKISFLTKMDSNTRILRICLFNLGIFQSPFDLYDKEVAESMSHTANYPLQFEACMLLLFINIINKMNFF